MPACGLRQEAPRAVSVLPPGAFSSRAATGRPPGCSQVAGRRSQVAGLGRAELPRGRDADRGAPGDAEKVVCAPPARVGSPLARGCGRAAPPSRPSALGLPDLLRCRLGRRDVWKLTDVGVFGMESTPGG